ncbi:MAG: hypothetical protein JO281_07425 [Pseudonocardiales bacterium]|nr:hypothetical protein [Pseudonocardiales bacterium]
MDLEAISWRLRMTERRVMRAVVRRLPGPVADRLRTTPPGPATTLAGCLRRALLTALRPWPQRGHVGQARSRRRGR